MVGDDTGQADKGGVEEEEDDQGQDDDDESTPHVGSETSKVSMRTLKLLSVSTLSLTHSVTLQPGSHI